MIPRCRSLPGSHVSLQTWAVHPLLPSLLLTRGKKISEGDLNKAQNFLPAH